MLRNTLLSVRDLLIAGGPFLLLAIALLAGAYWLLEPNPPRRVVLATGPEQSDYAEFGRRYAEAMRRHNIEVVLRPTGGSSTNRRLLRDPAESVDLGFVRGGSSELLGAEDETDGIVLAALGSLFYEPVWIFYREDAEKKLPGARLERLEQLHGWRLNTGTPGSGAANLIMRLLYANGLEPDDVQIERHDLTQAAMALFAGEVDAVAIVSAPESPMVQMFLRSPGIRLFEFTQAEAYARRFAYLKPVLVPRGVADLALDVPSRDVRLIAPTTMLVAREGTHPALVQLLVQAAHRIHAEPGWFARAGQFPSSEDVELPLAAEAERFYKNGAPLLQRYLPFWLANLIDRMWVVLISIVAILIPLSRIVPPLYAFRVRSRIFRWYRQLRDIEDALSANTAPAAELLDELNKLEARVELIPVPLSYTDELYSLRGHIALVRERLRKAEPEV